MSSAPSFSPASWMRPPASPPCPPPMAARATNGRARSLTAGAAEAFAAHYDEANERNVIGVPGLQPGQPVLDPQLLRDSRAPMPARCAPRSPARCGRRSTAPISSCGATTRKTMTREEYARFLEWVKSASLAFDGSAYRTMLRNDAYWFSRLGVYHRARRQHRAHPRREIPCAPARDGAGGRQPRLLPVVDDPARGLGADGLSLGLSREPEALARRGPADPQPADAALARVLLREHRARSSTISAGPMAGRAPRSACRAAFWRGWRTRASRTSSSSGLHEFISGFIVDNNKLGSAVTEQYLV